MPKKRGGGLSIPKSGSKAITFTKRIDGRRYTTTVDSSGRISRGVSSSLNRDKRKKRY